MATTVVVTGLKDVLARMQALGQVVGDKDSQKSVTKALRKAGQVLQKDMQGRVHVKTGTLKNNIIVTKKKTGNANLIELDVTVRFKATAYKDTKANRRKGRAGGTYKNYGPLFYAKFLEFGTSKMQAYPFMVPAFEAHKDELPFIFRDELSAAIDTALAKFGKT